MCDAADFAYFPDELRRRITNKTLQQWSEYQELRQREIDEQTED